MTQEVRTNERVRCAESCGWFKSGDRSGEPQLGLITDDCGRAEQLGGVGRQVCETARDSARDGLRAEFEHVWHVLLGRGTSVTRQRVEQGGDVEGIAARAGVQRCDERRVGLSRKSRTGKGSYRLLPEIAGTDHDRGRIGHELGHERGRRRLFRRARPEQHQEGQSLEPPCEVGEPAQRRLVGPVQIVDHEERRLAEGEVRGQPVEPVEHCVRRLPSTLCGGRRGWREERSAEFGRAREQLRSHIFSRRGQRSFEDLPHDSERELTLELAGTGSQHCTAGRARTFSRLPEQPGLANSGAALNHDETSIALTGCAEHRLECGDLGITLEQRRHWNSLCAGRHGGARRHASVSRASNRMGAGVWLSPPSSITASSHPHSRGARKAGLSRPKAGDPSNTVRGQDGTKPR